MSDHLGTISRVPGFGLVRKNGRAFPRLANRHDTESPAWAGFLDFRGSLGEIGAGRLIVMEDDGGRACPLRQLEETHGGVGVLPHLPPEQHAKLRPRQV